MSTASERFEGEKGAYRLEEPTAFARGRTSAFFRAEASGGGTVCIKAFFDAPKTPSGEPAAEEFLREIEARRRLDHPHILPILDYGAQGPGALPFIVLPLCSRGDLRSLLRSHDYLPLEQALPVLQQVAAAIDYAHRAGVVHGDIKPENILLGDAGMQVFLADFGVSRFFSFDEPIRTMPAERGSTAYLSPEQIRDDRQSPRSDIYSFALVAFELLTGRFPFDRSAPTFRQMQAKIAGTIVDPLAANPLLTPSAAQGLRRGLEVDESKRPASAAEFVAELGSRSAAVEATRSRGVQERWADWDTSAKVAVITAVIAALAGIIAGAIQIIPEVLTVLFGGR